MKKKIIQLNERIIKAIFSLNEVMVKNQKNPNLDPDFIKAYAKWYETEGEQILITMNIMQFLCYFSRKVCINKKSFDRLLNATKALKSIKSYKVIDFREMDQVEKRTLQYLKDFPTTGIIAHRIGGNSSSTSRGNSSASFFNININ